MVKLELKFGGINFKLAKNVATFLVLYRGKLDE